MAADARETAVGTSLMQELRPLAKRLSAASDDLNQALLTIQGKLNALGLGVEEWVQIPATRSWVKAAEDVRDQEWRESQLGYSKVGDGWVRVTRLAHSQGRDPEGEELVYTYSEARPLLRADRDSRLQAVKEIPSLVRLLKDRAGDVIEAIREAQKNRRVAVGVPLAIVGASLAPGRAADRVAARVIEQSLAAWNVGPRTREAPTA